MVIEVPEWLLWAIGLIVFLLTCILSFLGVLFIKL